MGVRSFRKIYRKLMDPVFTTVRPESMNPRYWPEEWKKDNIWYKQRTTERVRLGRAVILGALHVSGVDWVTEEFAQYDAEMTAEELKAKLLEANPKDLPFFVIITYFWIQREVGVIGLIKMKGIEDGVHKGLVKMADLFEDAESVQPRPPRRGGENSNG